ncbi:serine protease [Sorangium sp. So ce1036]|uniref:S1C family serine protease n=1 Tax=Sorangium sp. So ce1036 TaxID=3133328 RepID=UPI003F02781B
MRTALLTLVLLLALPRGVAAQAPNGKAATRAPSGKAASQAGSGPSPIQLRPLDRATVRVVTLSGIRPARVQSSRTGLVRLPAIGEISHGTGFVTDRSGLIVTAAHVTSGADLIAVLLPGHTDALAARVVFVHPERDVAVLHAAGSFADVLSLPAHDPPLQMAEQVSASGYPVDLRERYPAATAGVVSRQLNSGSLQLAMGVNPGNSGGPVTNGAGQLLGIVSQRGAPEAGLENIAVIEPLRHVRESVERARAVLRHEGAPAHGEGGRVLAGLLADFVRTSDERPVYEKTSLTVLQRASAAPRTPEEEALVAAHAWNMGLALLESRSKAEPTQLAPADRGAAERLLSLSLKLARDVNLRAPHVRIHYPIVRTIVVSAGRPFVPPAPRR